jgi:hypothetical protein
MMKLPGQTGVKTFYGEHCTEDLYAGRRSEVAYPRKMTAASTVRNEAELLNISHNLSIGQRARPNLSVQPRERVRTVSLREEEPDQTVLIGANLGP